MVEKVATFLYVDDSRAYGAVLEGVLKTLVPRANWVRVTTLAAGEAKLDEDPDAVLSDLKYPGRQGPESGGAEFYVTVRGKNENLPFAYVTSKPEDAGAAIIGVAGITAKVFFKGDSVAFKIAEFFNQIIDEKMGIVDKNIKRSDLVRGAALDTCTI